MSNQYVDSFLAGAYTLLKWQKTIYLRQLLDKSLDTTTMLILYKIKRDDILFKKCLAKIKLSKKPNCSICNIQLVLCTRWSDLRDTRQIHVCIYCIEPLCEGCVLKLSTNNLCICQNVICMLAFDMYSVLQKKLATNM
jgi:hypothetical protein